LIGTHGVAAEISFRLLTPEAGTTHPVALLVPGCSGFTESNGINHYEERAAELKAAGYAVVFVDYVAQRMQTNCAHISLNEVATDILDAAMWAREQPGTDASRISVIGWSYGGGGVLAALRAMPPEPSITKAVMYYPVCRGASPWSTATVGLMLLGANDDVAYPTLCDAVVKGVPGDRLTVITYQGARHGFDMRGMPERANPPPGAPAYNAEAAKASWATVFDFLRTR
jgi:dienelactone hydrolase